MIKFIDLFFYFDCFFQSKIKKIPIVLSHSITSKCNLSCCYCDQKNILGNDLS